MSQLHWEFASTGGGDRTGINDPVVTPFKGNIYYRLAREAIQNIIDARLPHKPAIATFSIKTFYPKELPGFDQLKDKLNACLITHENKPESVSFYKSAIRSIENNHPIEVLIISDYNTVGLSGGDEDEEGNYVSLMKSVGSSSKFTGEGGSFGLGKGAYFAASSFRTVYISSIYDGNKPVFQGKARLQSFKEEEDWKQGNGSYGSEKQTAVRNIDDIPKNFRRDEQGLDFYIVGFKAQEDWETLMTKSIINWFWHAILRKKLIVNVGNTEISASNIDKLMHELFSIEDEDSEEEPNPLPYYHAYLDEGSRKYKRNLDTLGNVELYILEKDGFPKKIAYMRETGMIIQKTSPGALNDYAGLFICDDEYGNKVLRAMENETHDEWNKDNVKENSEYHQAAKKADKELKEFVREVIRDLNKTQDGEVSTIGGLEEFLYLPIKDEWEKSNATGANATEEISQTETGYELSLTSEEQKAEVEKRRIDVTKNTDELVLGFPGGNSRIIIDGGPGDGTSHGTPDPSGNIKVTNPKKINYFRTYAIKGDDGETIHTIIIKNTPNLETDLQINAGTDDSYAPVKIVKAVDASGHEYKTSENIINNVKILGDGLLKMSVQFDTNERYSLILIPK